jgi:endonuclease YncB( thermonuclease family)
MRNGIIIVPLFFLLSMATVGSAQACEPDHVDSSVRVTVVYDGDTVLLNSGKKLRIIGLNAPELGYDNRPPQPYATAATRALETLLSRHRNRASIRYGKQRSDSYGRTLAHLFLPDGSSVSAQLIGQGLATALTIPPNTWNVDCYHHAESRARKQQLGIWSLPEYQVVEAKALPHDARGYRKVRGKVVRIGSSQRSTWLNLEGSVVLRVDHEDRRNFTNVDLVALAGEQVIASGWLYPRKRTLHMRIRHPRALEIEN